MDYSTFAAVSPEARASLTRQSVSPVLPLSYRFRATLQLARPRTCVVGMLSYCLGAGLCGATLAPRVVLHAVLCFFGAFVANLHNALSDVEEDSENLPGRVFVLYRLGFRRLQRLVVLIELAMIAAALASGWGVAVAMLVALVLVRQYSFGPLAAKKRPVTGLLVFALVVFYPFLVGALSDGDLRFARLLVEAVATNREASVKESRFLAVAAWLYLWFVAKGMTKNLPDYDGDRAAGVETSATILSSSTAAAGAAWAVNIGAYLSLLFGILLGYIPQPAAFALCLVPVAVWNGWRFVRARSAAESNRVLRFDMWVSVALVATLVVALCPPVLSAAALLLGASAMVAADVLSLDSRKDEDVVGSQTPITPSSPRRKC